MTTATTLHGDPLTVAPPRGRDVETEPLERNLGVVSSREYVARPRLIGRLEQDWTRPLVLLTAPAGYGKTILLKQWQEVSAAAFAWVTPHAGDHRPAGLAHSMAAAVGAMGTGRTRRRRFVVVLDDAHLVEPAVLQAVVPVVLGWLPDGCRLALASRCQPALGLGRMRAQRLVHSVNARDLEMTPGEAAQLLGQAGLDLDDTAVGALVQRTGGWPVALELAANSCGGGARSPDRAAVFSGQDHLIAEYFQAEILDALPPATVSFLTRTSILDQLTGSLCDHVLIGKQSGLLLSELERANVPLMPADASHEWYRLDGFFREMLQAELRRTEPELRTALHARASDWYLRSGEYEKAIDHARQAENLDRSGTLLWAHLPDYLGQGRNSMVQGWLRGVPSAGAPAPLALAAAHSHLAAGHVTMAEQWARCATAELAAEPDGSTNAQRAGALIITAWVGRLGAQAMGEAAAQSYDLLPEDSPWRAHCCFLRGSAALLTDDLGQAERILQEGAARGAVVALDAAALCFAQLSVVATERDEFEAASDFAQRARSIVLEHDLGGYPTCALVGAVCAVDAIRERRVDEAKAAASDCLALLDALDDSLCWYGAQVRILLAQVGLALGDVPGARARLADASRLARRTPDMALFSRWFDTAWNLFDTRAETALAQIATLTTAELRVLRFLPTHYSFHEIAQRLHVSSNTVKTHVHAVYRKLDASSRSEAVAHATKAGLLGF